MMQLQLNNSQSLNTSGRHLVKIGKKKSSMASMTLRTAGSLGCEKSMLAMNHSSQSDRILSLAEKYTQPGYYQVRSSGENMKIVPAGTGS